MIDKCAYLCYNSVTQLLQLVQQLLYFSLNNMALALLVLCKVSCNDAGDNTS